MSFLNFFKGFAVTFGKLNHASKSGKVVTTSYPEEKRAKPARLHGRHVLNKYEDGMEKCIGCELCASVCPANCIYVRGADNDLENPTSPRERFGFIYEINYLRCIHCDLCVEACPTQAITETKLIEFSFMDREHSIYTKDGTNCFRLNLSGEIDVPWTSGFPEFRDSAYSSHFKCAARS